MKLQVRDHSGGMHYVECNHWRVLPEGHVIAYGNSVDEPEKKVLFVREPISAEVVEEGE